MDQKSRTEVFKKYVERVAPEVFDNVDDILERRSNAEIPESFIRSGLERLSTGQELTHAESVNLEAIIHEHHRPAVFIVENRFITPPYPWEGLGDDSIRRRLEDAILRVGRVEVPQRPGAPQYGGTGFRVGEDLLMTNRHVAEIFTLGLGIKNLSFKPSWTAGVNFRKEVVATPDVKDLEVTEVVMMHPFWDMALLRVAGLPAASPLSLSIQHPDDLNDRDIVVLGYPAFDPRNDTDLQNRIFGGVYGVKRLQPGKVDSRRVVESFGNEVNALAHDASTLGGNSGSVVLDAQSGEVVGLHFGGLYLDANFAVPTYELARDSRVVDTGIKFSGVVEPTSDWVNRWKDADDTGKESSLIVDAGSNTGVNAGGNPIGSTSVNVDQSGSVSLTIPLHITVSLGGGTGHSLSQTDTSSLTEGVFGGSQSDEQILAAALALSSESHIGSGVVSHSGGLTSGSLSKLAYANQNANTQSRVKKIGFDTCEFMNENDTQCFVASNSRVVVVAFRGSEMNLGDWLGNIRAFRTDRSYGSVHKGFLHAFFDAREKIEQELQAVSTKNKQLVITGHSLGGALSLIAAAEWKTLYQVSEVYTFGQPAVGGRSFNRSMQGLIPKYLRYVYKRDIVARLPPLYRHLKSKVALPISVRESMLEENVNESEMLTEAEFQQVQSMLSGEILQEAPLDGFRDHSMSNYLIELTGMLQS